MDPVEISLILGLVNVAIQKAPALVSDLQALFAKGTPTQADFDALIVKVKGESYAQFVPASKLPAAQLAQ